MITFTITLEAKCQHEEFDERCIYCNSAQLLAKHIITDALYPRPSGTRARLDSYQDTSGGRWIPPFKGKVEEPQETQQIALPGNENVE